MTSSKNSDLVWVPWIFALVYTIYFWISNLETWFISGSWTLFSARFLLTLIALKLKIILLAALVISWWLPVIGGLAFVGVAGFAVVIEPLSYWYAHPGNAFVFVYAPAVIGILFILFGLKSKERYL